MAKRIANESRIIYIYTEKFTEGEWHSFRIIKVLQIPGEDQYFVAESRSGNRLLIPTRHYENYGIQPGIIVQCRIDRINCSGRIYLEPAHPFYKPGKEYIFKIIERIGSEDKKGRFVVRYLLHGEWDWPVFAELENNEQHYANQTIQGNLVRIHKSVLIMNNIRVINNC